MRKHAKMLHGNRGYNNWQLLFLCELCCFQNRNLWYNFQALFVRKPVFSVNGVFGEILKGIL